MSYDVVTEVLPEYIRLAVKGVYSLEQLFEFIDRIKLEADNAGRDHVLIDARGIDGKMTEADRFMAGRRVAEVFGPLLKATVIMLPDQITKLGELTALNRGAQFFVAGSEDEALRWLLGK